MNRIDLLKYLENELFTPDGFELEQSLEEMLIQVKEKRKDLDTELMNHIHNNDLINVKRFISSGISIDRDICLSVSVQHGYSELVKYFVEAGNTDLNKTYNEKNTILSYACARGDKDIAQYLIEHGAEVSANNNKAIRTATNSGNLDLIKYLVSVESEIPIGYKNFITNIIKKGHLHILNYFNESNLEFHSVNNKEMETAISCNNLNIVKFLVENETKFNIKKQESLIKAAGKLEIFTYLCDNEFDKKENNQKLLGFLVKNNHLEELKLLVQLGSDLNIHNNSLLPIALQESKPEIVEYLILQKLTLPPNNTSFFIQRAIQSDYKKLEILINHGIFPDLNIMKNNQQISEKMRQWITTTVLSTKLDNELESSVPEKQKFKI